MFVQREIKRFLRQVCGLKSDDQIDETRDGAFHFVNFFDSDRNSGVTLDEFCKVFLDENNFSTHEQADKLVTAILSAFRDYRIKRAVDPERAAKLTEMLDELYEKGKKKVRFASASFAYRKMFLYKKKLCVLHISPLS